jgi:hypothetical protein
MENLARPDEIVQRTHHLIRSRRHVPGVQVEEIDAIGPELPKALLHGPDHVEAVVAARIGVAGIAGHRELRRQDDALTLVTNGIAEEAFGRPVGIVHCGIDEVAAPIDIEVEDAAGLAAVGAPSPIRSEGHGAEAHGRDAQA